MKQRQLYTLADFNLVVCFQNCQSAKFYFLSIFPAIQYVHCLAHCTSLCLKTVGRQGPPIRDVLQLVMEVSQLMHFSPKQINLVWVTTVTAFTCHSKFKAPSPNSLESLECSYSVSLWPLPSSLWGIGSNKLGRHRWICLQSWRHVDFDGKVWPFYGLMLSHLLFAGMDQLSITLQHKELTVQKPVSASKLAVLYLERQRTEQAFEKFRRRAVQNF